MPKVKKCHQVKHTVEAQRSAYVKLYACIKYKFLQELRLEKIPTCSFFSYVGDKPLKCPSSTNGGQYKQHVVDHATLKSDRWPDSQQSKIPSVASTGWGHRAIIAVPDPTQPLF